MNRVNQGLQDQVGSQVYLKKVFLKFFYSGEGYFRADRRIDSIAVQGKIALVNLNLITFIS